MEFNFQYHHGIKVRKKENELQKVVFYAWSDNKREKEEKTMKKDF